MKEQYRKKSCLQLSVITPYLGVVLVFVLFGVLTKGVLFDISSLGNLVNNGLLIMICSVAAVPVFARGEMDFSLGSTEGICVMLIGYVVISNINLGWLGLLISIITGAVIGLINGLITNNLRIPSFVATISVNYVLRGVIYTMIDYKEVSFPTSYAVNYNVVVCFVVLVAVCIITYILMENTVMGKAEKLNGENNQALDFSGVNNRRYGVLAYVYLGVMVGVASYLITPRFTMVQATIGNTLAIDVLIALMIGGFNMSGGIGSKISQPIIGSVIIAVLNQGYALLNVESSIVQFTKGILFVVILTITSPGLLKSFKKIFGKQRNQVDKTTA